MVVSALFSWTKAGLAHGSKLVSDGAGFKRKFGKASPKWTNPQYSRGGKATFEGQKRKVQSLRRSTLERSIAGFARGGYSLYGVEPH